MNLLAAEIEQSRKKIKLNQDAIAEIMGIQSSKTFRNRIKSPDTFSISEIKNYADYLISRELDISKYPTLMQYSQKIDNLYKEARNNQIIKFPSEVEDMLNSHNQTATGDGIVQVGHGSSNNTINGYEQPKKKQDSHLLHIPYYDNIKSSAGFGAINGRVEEPEMFTLPKHLIPSASKDTEAIKCSGDSMSPALQDGDIMFIDRADNDVHDGEIYVVRAEDELYVKRLVRVPGKIIAQSDNKAYPDFELSGDNFEVLGRVIYRMERV